MIRFSTVRGKNDRRCLLDVMLKVAYNIPCLLVGTYVKERDNNRMKGGETGVVFWSKVYLSI